MARPALTRTGSWFCRWFLLSALGVTLTGCWIYVARWSKNAARWNLRRVHRVWGISGSLVSLMFVS